MTRNSRRLSEWAHDNLARGFDSEWKSRSFLAAIGTLVFLFPFSLFFVAGGFLPEQFRWMSSVIIIMSGIATLLSELRSVSIRTAVSRFLLIAGLMFWVEFIGVNTGFPFGRYLYTGELGLLVAGVPIAISIAWYCTVVNAWRIAEHLTRDAKPWAPVVVALVAGFLTLGLDIALEPMAGFIQKYWLWEANAIPLQNYVSWFILSTVVVYLLSRKRGEGGREAGTATSRIALFLFGFHFILFVLTILVNGYVLAAVAAMIVVSTPFAIRSLKMRLPQPDIAGR
jgi:uncharacterized membrane protein